MLLMPTPSSPENSWAFRAFRFLLDFGPLGSCKKHNLLETFVSFNACFVYVVVSFRLFLLLGRIELEWFIFTSSI
jgi:hypothetical protein